jgi:hypothetical protein
MLDEHTTGNVNHRLLIWSLLSLEWWVRTFLERSPAPTHPDAEQRRTAELKAGAP